MKIIKKYYKLSIVLIIAIFIGVTYFNYITPKVKADSGFDGSYDGGSSWSGGSDWGGGSSWDSDSSYGGSSSGSGEPLGIVGSLFVFGTFFFIIILFIMMTGKSTKKFHHSSANGNYSSNRNKVIPYDIIKITKVLPDFNVEEFRKTTYDIYKNIQVAWMEFDYDSLRNLTTDEMYNMYISQLETLKLKKQQNVMRDFNLYDFEVIGMETDNTSISITVAMMISCYDYIVDQVTYGKLRGRTDAKVVYHYNMTFIRSISDSNNINYCPNCGAPVSDKASKKCAYCDSVIVSDNHAWVLSKKQVVNQKYE